MTRVPSHADASREASRLAGEAPVTLDRPVVAISGWRSPAFMAVALARALRRLTGADASMIRPYWVTMANNFDAAASGLVRRVDASWPSDGEATTEVDAVCISMGGLVAEHAATWPGRRLRVRRLFTIVTPHRGAALSRWVALDASARAMRPGCAFIRGLNEAAPGAIAERVCYGRERDWWVGVENTAPPGRSPIRVPTPWWSLGHMRASGDPRLLVDIARRLRGQTPFLTEPRERGASGQAGAGTLGGPSCAPHQPS